jgi:hypothetical protein
MSPAEAARVMRRAFSRHAVGRALFALGTLMVGWGLGAFMTAGVWLANVPLALDPQYCQQNDWCLPAALPEMFWASLAVLGVGVVLVFGFGRSRYIW